MKVEIFSQMLFHLQQALNFQTDILKRSRVRAAELGEKGELGESKSV
jgi:hypothetical protein